VKPLAPGQVIGSDLPGAHLRRGPRQPSKRSVRRTRQRPLLPFSTHTVTAEEEDPGRVETPSAPNKPQRPAKPRYAAIAAHCAQDPASTPPTSTPTDSVRRLSLTGLKGGGCHATKNCGCDGPHARRQANRSTHFVDESQRGKPRAPRGRPKREFKC
jgi:hypothetical protein